MNSVCPLQLVAITGSPIAMASSKGRPSPLQKIVDTPSGSAVQRDDSVHQFGHQGLVVVAHLLADVTLDGSSNQLPILHLPRTHIQVRRPVAPELSHKRAYQLDPSFAVLPLAHGQEGEVVPGGRGLAAAATLGGYF
eukprot:CAMPEP_0114324126 /NCGR_PEP_ID=MMETSP0059-20121206/28327_1 /TAXON_ID=36894 /ORGANISM="Pyramimonas parkeae, Strain CCMP726" /LENGTH=136 /DNA_ID=CAMNT_0001452617 /DNA_START=271 /DNA_END=682 /DNA_ORIENTATION=-